VGFWRGRSHPKFPQKFSLNWWGGITNVHDLNNNDVKSAARLVIPSNVGSKHRPRRKIAHKELMIAFRNVQGLRREAKQAELVDYVVSEGIDVMAVVETHLKGDEKLDSSPTFSIVQKNREFNDKGRGGIGIYVKKTSRS
jgi:hypothetical protein